MPSLWFMAKERLLVRPVSSKAHHHLHETEIIFRLRLLSSFPLVDQLGQSFSECGCGQLLNKGISPLDADKQQVRWP